MFFQQGADFILPRRIVKLLHLRKPAFAKVAGSASGRIELADGGKRAFDPALVDTLEAHHYVRHGTPEITIVVDVSHEGGGKFAVFGRNVRKGDLAHQMLLQRLALDHRIEKVVAAGLYLFVPGGALKVAEKVVAVSVVRRTRAHDGAHLARRTEVEGLFRHLRI